MGARLWELVQEPKRVSDLTEAIAQEYEVETQQCVQDVLTLLEQMRTEGLLEVADG